MSSTQYKQERQFTLRTDSKGVNAYKNTFQLQLLEDLLQHIAPTYRKISLTHTSITNMDTLYILIPKINKLLNGFQ